MRRVDVFFPPDPQTDGVLTAFGAVFGIVVFLGIATVIVIVVVAVRKYRVLKDAGVDPFTVDATIAARLANGQLLAPTPGAAPAPRSMEERLAEVDSLLARGVISASERDSARAEILRS